jgi:AcrR family transcriptional regulator
VTEAILGAAIALVEEDGIDALTVDQIAARAEVTKPTLYRRWPSKEALLEETLEVMFDRLYVEEMTGNVRDDLIQFASITIERLQGPLRPLMDFIYTVRRAELAPEARARAKERLQAMVTRGIERGELRRDTNPALVMELVMGAIWYRITARNEHLDESYAEEVVDGVLQSWLVDTPS